VAKWNIKKSAAVALGPWNTTQNVMGIPYNDEMKILGVEWLKTLQSATKSWATVTGKIKIRAQAREAYYRNLSLDQRILYVHNFLLAKAWYTPQLPPTPWRLPTAIEHGGILVCLERRHLSNPIVHTLQKEKSTGTGP